jgi:hypothetical protein
MPRPTLQQNKDKLYQGTQQSSQDTLKKEILQISNENFKDMLLNRSTKNYMMHSRKSKTTKIKSMRKNKNK